MKNNFFLSFFLFLSCVVRIEALFFYLDENAEKCFVNELSAKTVFFLKIQFFELLNS